MSHAVTYPAVHPRFLSEEPYIPCDPQDPRRPYTTGQELRTVITNLAEALRHYQIPISRQQESTAERFQALLRQWKGDVGPLSSVTEMAMHPAYQRIIGLGREAVPLLLRELAKEPDHWFWALKAITGVDPVEPAHRGRVKDMADAWLLWGKEQGLL